MFSVWMIHLCYEFSLCHGCCLPPGTDLDYNTVNIVTPAGNHLLELMRSNKGVYLCAMYMFVLSDGASGLFYMRKYWYMCFVLIPKS